MFDEHSKIDWAAVARRFWSHVQRGDGCWLWTGQKKKGYGNVKMAGKWHGAHRIAWIVQVGFIPKGMCVLHHCDNPPCVRADHLFLGTLGDNVRDMVQKGRAIIPKHDRDNNVLPKGADNVMTRLTVEQVIEIKTQYRKRIVPARVFAKRFGVCDETIGAVIRGITWHHIQPPSP